MRIILLSMLLLFMLKIQGCVDVAFGAWCCSRGGDLLVPSGLCPHTRLTCALIKSFQLSLRIDNNTDRQHAEGRQGEVWHHCRPQPWPQYVNPPVVPEACAIERQNMEVPRLLTQPTEVTPRTPAPRISRRKGFLSKRTAFVREITREVAGYVTHANSTDSDRAMHAKSTVLARVLFTLANTPAALPHTRSVSSNCSETPRTSVPVVWPRRGYVFLSSSHPIQPLHIPHCDRN
jgi:hypothetical protein